MADLTIASASSSAITKPQPSTAASAKQAAAVTMSQTSAAVQKAATAGSKPSSTKSSASKRAVTKKAAKDILSVSKDGDTAHASKKSRTMLKENGQASTIESRARIQAERATDFLREQIAHEELKDNLVNDATVEMGRVQANTPNPFIETLKAELQEEIRKAQFESNASRDEAAIPNIEIDYEPVAAAEASEALQESDYEPVIEDEPLYQPEAMEPAQNPIESATYKPQITSFNGYSDQQLRQLYLDGTISRYDYDSVMTKRSEENKEFAENEKVFREGIVRDMATEERVERTDDNLDNAYAEEASETLTAEQRLAMINAAEYEDA